MNVLDQNIKDIIRDFPAVADTLSAFGIACVTCNVGTCKLRDVVEIHNLPPDREQNLFDRVAAIVCPGTRVAISDAERKVRVSKGRKLSPPMQRLVEEHTYIKRVLALIPQLTAGLDADLPARKPLIEQVLGFIRGYADTYHHAKEEDILFGFFDPQTEVIVAFRQEHEVGRGHVRAAAEGLARGDAGAVATNLRAYGELLAEHIRKEDDILYPWIDQNLSDSAVGQLFSKFAEVDARFGDKPATFEAFVGRSEQDLARPAGAGRTQCR